MCEPAFTAEDADVGELTIGLTPKFKSDQQSPHSWANVTGGRRLGPDRVCR